MTVWPYRAISAAMVLLTIVQIAVWHASFFIVFVNSITIGVMCALEWHSRRQRDTLNEIIAEHERFTDALKRAGEGEGVIVIEKTLPICAIHGEAIGPPPEITCATCRAEIAHAQRGIRK